MGQLTRVVLWLKLTGTYRRLMPGPVDELAPYVIPLSEDGRITLSVNPIGRGGWVAYHSDETDAAGLRVLLRIGVRQLGPDEPLEVREFLALLTEPGQRFNGQALREIQFGRVEAAINRPDNRAELLDVIAHPEERHVTPPTVGRFLERPDPRPTPRPYYLKVEDPGGYRKPDRFYRQVAEAFLWLASVSNAPAQELAEVNGVRVGTVHRWVREAKLRGLLRLPSHRERRDG